MDRPVAAASRCLPLSPSTLDYVNEMVGPPSASRETQQLNWLETRIENAASGSAGVAAALIVGGFPSEDLNGGFRRRTELVVG